MATVYLAVDPKHHRNMAIKVLRPELATALGAERFLHKIGYCPFMAPLRGMAEYERIMVKARGRWEAFRTAVTR